MSRDATFDWDSSGSSFIAAIEARYTVPWTPVV